MIVAIVILFYVVLGAWQFIPDMKKLEKKERRLYAAMLLVSFCALLYYSLSFSQQSLYGVAKEAVQRLLSQVVQK